MTFFVPPSDARECRRRVIEWLEPILTCCPNNVWMRGDVVMGTLVGWGKDHSGHMMAPSRPAESPWLEQYAREDRPDFSISVPVARAGKPYP